MKQLDDYALKFESIIRRAKECERYGDPFADADVYRKLLAKYHDFLDSGRNEYEKTKEEFVTLCNQISEQLDSAAKKLGIFIPKNISKSIHGINIQIDNILDELSKRKQ
jgi:hypothetical protein